MNSKIYIPGLSVALILAPILLSAQQPQAASTVPKLFRPISFQEFRMSVLKGDQITGRIIPPAFILRVMAQAPQLQKNPMNKAWIRLKSCRITCQPVIKMMQPSQPITQFDSETRNHLTNRYPGKTEATHLDLPVDLNDVEVGSELSLNDIVIRAPLMLDNVDFNKDVSFQGAVFERGASFHNVRFKARSDFSGILIRENLNFEESQFSRQAAFAKSVIEQKATAYFSGYRIDVPLDFSESTILGKLTFEGVTQTFQLAGKLYLNGINFDQKDPRGELRIKNAELRDEVYLDRDKWAKLNFAESEAGFHRPIRFVGSYDFRQSIFKIADFGGVEFEGFGDFTGTIFTDFVSFERAKFRRPVQLRWTQIDHKLGKPEATLIARNNFSEIDLQTYEELERNFDALADIESSNECRFQKRLFSGGRRIEWAMFGYEAHPTNPFVTGCLLFTLFCLVNTALFRIGAFSDGVLPRRPFGPMRLTWYTVPLWKKDFPAIPANYTGTVTGQVFFWAQVFIMKILLVGFALAWMNKSRLLKELIPYFWPK